jgi:hypothetical protein
MAARSSHASTVRNKSDLQDVRAPLGPARRHGLSIATAFVVCAVGRPATAGSISGVARLADSSPVPGICVRASPGFGFPGRAVTDAEGRYTISALSKARYRVHFYDCREPAIYTESAPFDDAICGGAGDDRIDGGGGNDSIEGGAGSDVLRGGKGDDAIIGGRGDDALLGGTGEDDLRDLRGSNELNGGDGRDRCRGAMADGVAECELP